MRLFRNFFYFFAVLSFVMVLERSLAAPPAPSLSLQQDGTKVYLVTKNARLLLADGNEWMTNPFNQQRDVSLRGGYTVSLPTGNETHIVVRKGNEIEGKISLIEAKKRWLADDAVWGGHAQANRMRYMWGQGAPVQALLSDAVAVGDSLLAVFSWKDLPGSGQPIKAQHLVRILVTPQPAIEIVQNLNGPEWEDRELSPRLFQAGGRLLLLTGLSNDAFHYNSPPPRNLVEIAPDGKELRKVATFPSALVPAGLLDAHWLILMDSNNSGILPPRFWSYDLPRRKLSALPGNWSGYTYAIVPTTGRRFLIIKERTTYIVTMPGGSRIALPNPTGCIVAYLWKGMAVQVDSIPVSHVRVYEETSGRLLKRLTVKPSKTKP